MLDFARKQRSAPPNIKTIYQQKKGAGAKGVLKGCIHALLFVYTSIISKRKTPTQDYINQALPLDSNIISGVNEKLLFAENEKAYDILICGSDQIWAYWCLGPHFLLETKRTFTGAKIAYAPSFGNISKLQSEQHNYLKSALKTFSAISCREHDGAELIEKLTGKECPILPDPTMLHNRDFWIKEARKPANFPYKEKKFVFTYRISFMPHAAKIARHAARQLNLPLVTCELIEPHSYYSQMGPREFLWCIAHAAHVITPSFHGTVFSIIMGTPFHSIVSKAPQNRLKTLLNTFNLDNRLVSSKEEINCSLEQPLPQNLSDHLDLIKCKSTAWLKNTIINAQNKEFQQ